MLHVLSITNFIYLRITKDPSNLRDGNVKQYTATRLNVLSVNIKNTVGARITNALKPNVLKLGFQMVRTIQNLNKMVAILFQTIQIPNKMASILFQTIQKLNAVDHLKS